MNIRGKIGGSHSYASLFTSSVDSKIMQFVLIGTIEISRLQFYLGESRRGTT